MEKKISINGSIFLDEDMGRHNFSENMKTIAEDVLLYTDNGNLSDEVEELQIEHGQNDKLIELVKKEDYLADLMVSLDDCESQDERDDAIVDFVKEMILDNKLCDRDVSTQMEYFKNNDIKSNWDNYESIRIPGYSQGDAVEVLINVPETEKVWGNKVDPQSYKDELNHYINDAPMTIRLNVNENEYISDKDGFYDQYKNYDKDELVSEFKKMILTDFPELKEEILKDALEDIIPSEISTSISGQTTSIHFQELTDAELTASLKAYNQKEESKKVSTTLSQK